MKKILCGILALAVLFSSLGTNLVFAAPDMTTNNGFLDVEAEDLSFDKDFLQKTEKNKLYSNSYGLSIKDEDKTEPAADDPAHLGLVLYGGQGRNVYDLDAPYGKCGRYVRAECVFVGSRR